MGHLLRREHDELRSGFERLALHARLDKWHSGQRWAATRRLASALSRPPVRLVRSSFGDWVVYWGSPQAVWRTERRRALRKRVHLGAAILKAFMQDWRRDACRLALSQLSRHIEGLR